MGRQMAILISVLELQNLRQMVRMFPGLAMKKMDTKMIP